MIYRLRQQGGLYFSVASARTRITAIIIGAKKEDRCTSSARRRTMKDIHERRGQDNTYERHECSHSAGTYVGIVDLTKHKYATQLARLSIEVRYVPHLSHILTQSFRSLPHAYLHNHHRKHVLSTPILPIGNTMHNMDSGMHSCKSNPISLQSFCIESV